MSNRKPELGVFSILFWLLAILGIASLIANALGWLPKY